MAPGPTQRNRMWFRRPWSARDGRRRLVGYKFIPENMTRLGSYFCRTALSRAKFGPKYRDGGWPASR
ncbi:hypothetical protein I546_3618 [Mycobacterium kansasii 732]|nr:hypothetical protein I546_3618 [Mycobacterium kansasii 732]